MTEQLYQEVAKQLQIPIQAVMTTLQLLDEGNTVPFIARYRKEQTGSLDETQIRNIAKQWQSIQQLEKRREQIIRLIDEQGMLTHQLKKELIAARKMTELDDLYLPFQQKRQTKATAAIALGLEPFAKSVLSGQYTYEQLATMAQQFYRDELITTQQVFEQTGFILAQWFSERIFIRQAVRQHFQRYGFIVSKQKSRSVDEKQTFKMYYAYEMKVAHVQNHQVLALNRGEKLGILQVKLAADLVKVTAYVMAYLMTKLDDSLCQYIEKCYQDAYKRLIFPSIEREIRQELTQRASTQAITVFSQNIQQLLLQPPLKGRIILGLDPAYRTGCKLAVIDAQGALEHIAVVYPHQSAKQKEAAQKVLNQIIDAYGVTLIAIGNGTASRESEEFIAELLKKRQDDVAYLLVSEAGASVYSASKQAIAEFPDLQVEQRSAVSIARRVLDPLAELIKIDPQSLGVGQYQHDLPSNQLQDELQAVVESAVNKVGVELNTASVQLLTAVSGLNATVAKQIIQYRDTNGAFTSREQLKNVPRLGAKTFEQAAGFLRIQQGIHPFDTTPIHPESYPVAMKILQELGFETTSLGSSALEEKIASVKVEALSDAINASHIIVSDILAALCAPNRDPRDEYPQPLLRKDVLKFSDLEVGMILEGTVRNIVDFGAFVDIGVKVDGLIHKSKFGKRIQHPLEVVSINDIVQVEIIEIDEIRQTISLQYMI